MSKIPCKWVGPILDSSGYASATRNYVCSLIQSDQVDLTVDIASFEQQKTTHGMLQKMIEPYIGKRIPHKIQITHLTPENYPSVRSQGKYNIAYTVWETDMLPKEWTELCNTMDEIWVPSNWNKEIFAMCGVNKPIYVIPHIIPIPDLTDMKNISMGVDDDIFVFYSIFQWIERKNPLGLLRAFLTEFSPKEKVCLALKTYRIDCSAKEQAIIKQDIANVKRGLNLPEYPQVRFFGTLLPFEYMKGFHNRGNCFVLAHRAEGFGIPHAEAMSYGKPVIATKYGGNLEFMNEENSFLIKYQKTPVTNMIFPIYHGHMTWADPDLMCLRRTMRDVFNNRKLAETKGEKAKRFIKENLNSKRVGDLIIKRLKEIAKGL